MVSAVQDRLDIPIATLRDYMRADPVDDGIIEIIYEGVKAKADRYMKNDFTDGEGEELPIPADIKLWVLEMVGRKYNRRANGIQSEREDGLGSIAWSAEEMSELNKYRRMAWP